MNIGELAKFRGGIATDTISEQTSASGVTIDSVLCKDGSVTCAASGTVITTYVKAADTQGLALVNSSGTSVVTVTDAGAVTAGASSPGDATITHTMNCAILRIDNRDSTSGTDAYLSYRLLGTEKYQAGLSGTDYFVYSNTAAANVALCSSAGAWSFGQVGGTPRDHVFNVGDGSATNGIRVRTSSTIAAGRYNYMDFSDGGASKCEVGCTYQSGTSATGYLFTITSGSATGYYIWHSTGTWYTSSTPGNVGSTTGTVIGTQTSDERTKENIVPCSYGLATVLALEPIEFDQNGKHKAGFGAQRTATVFSEAVYDTGDKDFGKDQPSKLAMDYTQIIAPMVKAIQELSAQVTALQAKVAALEAK